MATTYGYEDICEKPFRKISEHTVGCLIQAFFQNVSAINKIQIPFGPAISVWYDKL